MREVLCRSDRFVPSLTGPLDWSSLTRLMTEVSVYDAKTHLSKLLDRAAAGEEIVITRHGRPIARLSAWAPTGARRRLGALRGKVRITKDFDEPLPDDVLADFEGGS